MPLPASLIIDSRNGSMQAACAGIRALCPTRPSPIVVHRLLLLPQHGKTRHQDNNGNADPVAVDTGEIMETRRDSGKAGARKMRGAGGRVPGKGRGGGRGEESAFPPPSWLFSSMPFYDDATFAAFFCDVLRGSERLALQFT